MAGPVRARPAARAPAPVVQDKATVEALTAEDEEEAPAPRVRKRRKQREQPTVLDWDDDYDPARPNNYEEFKASDEAFVEDEDWRQYLLELKAGGPTSAGSAGSRSPLSRSASPRPLRFAPPTELAEPAEPHEPHEPHEPAPPAAPPAEPPADGPVDAATISRQAVLYDVPAAEIEAELASAETEAEAAPSAQAVSKQTFAERLMTKYGWTPGSGLGSAGDGIVRPLRVAADKKNKGYGKIVGGGRARKN
ncbi:uncharacterized protein V1510DRAFT_414029 [Dipodascopsis tothii]|uniref:uncharacterized protein n=1 Tax=Dipodascopsis tothii TaxID=44089 RepID=UPI0034CFEE60